MSILLVRFVIFAIAWCVPYLALLGYLLSRPRVDSGAVSSVVIVFTAILTSMERHFRRRDRQRDVRYNLSLRYSLVSIAVSSLGAALWALQVHSALLFLCVEAALVAALLAVGFLWNKPKIKGSSKDELFQ
jgi:hypothetical protein